MDRRQCLVDEHGEELSRGLELEVGPGVLLQQGEEDAASLDIVSGVGMFVWRVVLKSCKGKDRRRWGGRR